jgi:hypothetical protein
LTSGSITRFLRRRCERLGFQLVSELPKLVDVDSRPEAKRMWLYLWRSTAARPYRFSQSDADRPVGGLLERDTQFARSPTEFRDDDSYSFLPSSFIYDALHERIRTWR